MLSVNTRTYTGKGFFGGEGIYIVQKVCTIRNLKCPEDYLHAKLFWHLNTVKTIRKISLHNGRAVSESRVFNRLHKEHEIFKIKLNLKDNLI